MIHGRPLLTVNWGTKVMVVFWVKVVMKRHPLGNFQTGPTCRGGDIWT